MPEEFWFVQLPPVRVDRPTRWLQRLAKFVPSMGFGRCCHCHLPWWVRRYHLLQYDARNGVPLACEACWRRLPRPCRLLYAARHGLRVDWDHATWMRVVTAIEEEVDYGSTALPGGRDVGGRF